MIWCIKTYIMMWNVKGMSQLDAALTGVPLTLTFDLELWRSICISEIGGPIVMEQKGREPIWCPDVKHDYYVTSRQRMLLGTGWLKMFAFPSTPLVVYCFVVTCAERHVPIYGSYVPYIYIYICVCVCVCVCLSVCVKCYIHTCIRHHKYFDISSNSPW